jgi:acetoin utilization deacetylase AcuC-like enzyme
MKAYSSERFVLPLPTGHRFPMEKYTRLRGRVEAELRGVTVLEPEAASDALLCLGHDAHYVERVTKGLLSAAEQREIGFPWSEQMVERSRRSVGATLAACRAAMREGVAVSLAGGTHHAMHGRGQGFCVFNDSAVATRAMQAEHSAGPAFRVAIVDLDVHQGNGTAEILAGDEAAFTLSIHCEENFPVRKARGCLDVALAAGVVDDEYLAALDDALERMLARFDPDLIIYVAGADPHEGDRLGRLRLSIGGLAERDARVLHLAASRGVPIAITMAGGYGRDIERTVEAHFNTVRLAFGHWRVCRSAGWQPDYTARQR